MKIIIKSGEHQGKEIDDVVALAKNLIGPNDLAVGGTMSPQRAARLIGMIYEDKFLAKITTDRMDRLEKEIDVIGVETRQLVRVPQGQEPSNDQKPGASQHGDMLRAQTVQLFPEVSLDYLRAHRDNPDLVKLVEQLFVQQLRNDLVDLGFNGVNDDGSGETADEKFLALNKGWVQVAKEATQTPKKDIDPMTDGWGDTLALVMDAADVRYRANSTFVMNLADADAYAREMGAHVTGTPLTADSPLRRYQGNPIEAHPLMPQGHILFTPMPNLVFGVHKEIRQDRGYHQRKRALEYTFDQAVDYQIAVKQAAVLGKPA